MTTTQEHAIATLADLFEVIVESPRAGHILEEVYEPVRTRPAARRIAVEALRRWDEAGRAVEVTILINGTRLESACQLHGRGALWTH